MKKALLSSSLLLLSFCVACGSGGNHIGGPTPQGNFSNASLNGQYAYHLAGTDLNTGAAFREAGVFTANGNGTITSGNDDFSEGNSGVVPDPISGSYSIANDGTGTMVFNLANGSITLAITMVSSSRLQMIEADGFANARGGADRQTASAFSAPPSGTFAFRLHTVSTASGSTGGVGVLTVSNGTVASGFEDVNDGGVLNALTLTGGLFNPPDNTGRGTGSFTDSSPATTDFVYYVIDANNFRILSSDPGILGLGHAEKQTGPFNDASLSGDYAFGSAGDTNAVLGGSRTVGRFHADGAGNISAGAFDSAQDGVPTLNGSFNTGTYTLVDSTGRTVVTLNSSNGTIVEIFQMVNSSRGFLLVVDPNKVEDGSMDAQTVSSFSNSTMNGQFSFVMDGFDPIGLLDRVGTLQWDGNGNLLLNELVNREGGVQTPGFLPGTYQVSSNGRATGSVGSLSNNLVFYLISGSDGYILQADSNTEVDGSMTLQH
jgi:hypothetical protein